jgi:beta-glucosidase
MFSISASFGNFNSQKMRKLKTIFLLVVLSLSPLTTLSAQTGNTDLPDSEVYFRGLMRHSRTPPNISVKVEALLRKMTLEEKIGQLAQLTVEMITTGKDQAVKIDNEKLEKAVVKYGVGSILNVNNQALSIDRWYETIEAIQSAAQRTRLKIPVLYGIDSIHGANYVQGSTLFPQEIGMAATWNPALMKRAAEITAIETRAAGIPWSFSPVLDVGRKQNWPRFWETFGEDPYLGSVMGTAFLRGLQGDDISGRTSVAASLKHYVGYSFPLTGRDRTSALIAENYLREYFLPTFASAVHAGARTVMVNSADVNGIPGHINKHLLTDVLKGELGFDGFVVSDWEDIKKLVTQWKVAPDEKEATRLAVMAGVDMSMVPLSYSFSDNLIALVKEKKVPMTRIDDAVRRILRVKFELGLFENATPNKSLRSEFGRPEYAQVSLDAARESITLLKNSNNVLPLSKKAKVLVTGPTSDSLIPLNNGWTYVWQGSEEALYPKDKLTVRQAIEQKLGRENVKFIQGTRLVRRSNSPSNSTPTDIDQEVDIDAAAEAARSKNVDVVVLCLGEGSYTEQMGSIADLTLPDAQLDLANAVIASGKPVILVLVEGRPRVISAIADRVSGIVMAYNPSNEGGGAIADVLFGDYNPNGKLPFTYPRSAGYLTTYDAQPFDNVTDSRKGDDFKPQFEFGIGLSYTTFSYSNISLSSNSMSWNGEVKVSIDLRNSGQREGKETVILYVRDDVASLSPPARRVRRFAKISLKPGETKKIVFTLTRSDLEFVNSDNKSIAEPGKFTVFIGNSSAEFSLNDK